LRWFHNFEALTATLSLSSLALETNPVLPGVLGVEFVAAAHHCANVGLGAGASQLAIGVTRTGILSQVRITCLSFAAFPWCYFAYTRSSSTWLHVVKRAPCHVLETRMLHVMDGRVVSRGLYFTLGNPEPQPSCLAMDVAASPVLAS
jgi:hypothetical protein